MTAKKTVADAILEMPAKMAKAALAELPTEVKKALTPGQAGAILEVCTSVTKGIAFILERPTARLIRNGDALTPPAPGEGAHGGPTESAGG